MDRRTYESPMDWEYQGTGPVDVTSPFTQIARNNPKNNSIFSSPAKPTTQSSFSSSQIPSTPSRQQAPPPPSSFFTPRIPGGQTAPPFRNPAFTTPRRPFDELALSEASGAESSPAFTENSDLFNETPELDRFGDLNMATITPSRVDKSIRYGKNNPQSRRHAPGRGEIPRPSKDLATVDFVRKRKKRNHDRDVAGSRARHGSGWGDDSEDNSDDSLAGERMARSRERKRKSKNMGLMGGLFNTMQQNPDFAEQAHKLIRLSLHLIVVGSVMFIGWKGYSAVSADITTANRAAQVARLNKIAECTKQYNENHCANGAPALRELCEQWSNCMTDDPDTIYVVRNMIKEVASILNEFSGEMHLKAWGFFFLTIMMLIISSNMATARAVPKAAPTPMVPPYATGAAPWAAPMPSEAYHQWMHVQTPRTRRHQLEMDDGTDTDDGSFQSYRPSALKAPQTPSGSRSPTKGDRTMSPIKLNRSPAKRY
ncbi:hypothetical protein jhhlp_000595 [Lomentospora prolificans]|uniref:Brl1/Brr6 domain-containing protein n=1 Tax=Lomentospora prolificans TaxID=41688 RepID=A0A2N3NJ01_9PEZI|nr:hypothetical protein jhhlp_000595 [Lomentospora prolificans]